MSDLPDRLRHCAGSTTDAEARLLVEAATEIDDLYVVVRTQIIEIYDLRTELNDLYEFIEDMPSGNDALDAWREARRG